MKLASNDIDEDDGGGGDAPLAMVAFISASFTSCANRASSRDDERNDTIIGRTVNTSRTNDDDVVDGNELNVVDRAGVDVLDAGAGKRRWTMEARISAKLCNTVDLESPISFGINKYAQSQLKDERERIVPEFKR
jgi:hypothetical protein